MTVDAALASLAESVGTEGPVVAVGGRTQWDVGGAPDPIAREVRPAAGIMAIEPADMTARCRAGTTVAELDAALAEVGQLVALPPHGAASTVGGVLAVGRSGVRRLGYGPVRDTLLQARYVSADGRVVTAGGPTVKNVSGYDLCRLLVGSLGTIGIVGEVLLRTRPLPPCSRWFEGEADPFPLRRALYAPVSLLWDGRRTWVLLEGHADDVAAEAVVVARHGLDESAGPPPLPAGARASVEPGELRRLPALVGDTAFVAEIGVGVVHLDAPLSALERPAPALGLQQRIKAVFDPAGRLAPGRSVTVR